MFLAMSLFVACGDGDTDRGETDGDTADGDELADGDTTDIDAIDGNDINEEEPDTNDSDLVDGDVIDGEATDSESGDEDTDVSDGTWYDSSSGLTWQNPPAESDMIWQDALDYCSNLSLDGGNWRLPTISELRTLIRGCEALQTGGSCGITDDCLSFSECWEGSCTGCGGGTGPGDGCYWPVEMEGACTWYWSSSPYEDEIGYMWFMRFVFPYVHYNGKQADYAVRCVR